MPLPLPRSRLLPESLIQRKTIKAYEAQGWLVVKIIQTNRNGWPDLQCHKNGETVFIEVKKEGKTKLDPLQLLRHEQLAKQGFKVIIVNHV